MKRLIQFLESYETLLRATLMVMGIYTIHNSYILNELEHIDLSFQYNGYRIVVINAVMALMFSAITEFMVLVLLMQGYKMFARIYAISTFFLNTFYYWYFMPEKLPALMVVGLFVSFIHLAAIWYCGDLFYMKRQEKIAKPERKIIQPNYTTVSFSSSSNEDLNAGLQINKEDLKNIPGQLGRLKSVSNDFRCELCDKPFASKYSLERHISTMHNQPEEEV